MPNAPTTRIVQLTDGRLDPPVVVQATIIRDFVPAQLENVENSWSETRELAAIILTDRGEGGEHGHWDWRNKVWAAESGRLRLVAVECGGDVQGLMAVRNRSRPTAFVPEREEILYVDYLETAPWNLRGLPDRPRFLGVGTVLIAEAIKLSLETEQRGRVGLHSLPQSERFYQGTCRMNKLGADPDYYDLVYFEYTEEQAAIWLEASGLSQ